MQKELNKEELERENTALKAQLSFIATCNSQPESGDGHDDEIDLAELLGALWKRKWFIIIITFIFSACSIVYALSIPDEYKSTVLLAPASTSSSSTISKLASKFGGLASLAGFDLDGGGTEDKTAIAVEIIQTWGFIEKFIRDNQIEVEVYAAKGWNRIDDKLIIEPEIYDINNKKWKRKPDVGRGLKPEPSGWELYKKFKDRVSIGQDKKSGLISLSVEYYSPKIAKIWVEKLVKAINAHIQRQERVEAKKSIEYLDLKIEETTIAEMQSVFYKLIEEQTKTLMLAEISDEYVFKTMSQAKVPQEKTKPQRVLICILGTILGGVVSILVVFFLRIFRQK